MRNQDPPTEDEETSMTRLGMASGETRTEKVQFCEPNSGRRKEDRRQRMTFGMTGLMILFLLMTLLLIVIHLLVLLQLLSMMLILLRSMLGRRLTIQLASLQIRSPQLIALSATLLLP